MGERPWEKYAQPEPQAAPWERYGAAPEPEQPSDSNYARQAFSGLLEGATGALGAPVDLVNNFLVRPATQGINAVFGTDIQPSDQPLGGSRGLQQGLAIDPQSEGAGEQFVRRTMQSVGGAAVPMAGQARTLNQALAGFGAATAGGVGGATAQQMFPESMGAEMLGELAGGVAGGAGIATAADRFAQRAAERAVPSVQDLRQGATQLYQRAEARGVVADPQMTTDLASSVRQIARDNELITPTGRVSAAYPRAAEAMNLLDDYAGHPMNPTQMQVIRDTLADARNATMGKERRISGRMLNEFDQFTAPLAPELQEARAVSQRAFKGAHLEQLREIADANSNKFSAAGQENAMRTEYRNLQKDIIRGDEMGWTPEQQEAIERVAQGSFMGNRMRGVGKMAPTGPMSFIGGAGVPFMAGNAIGGPGLGTAMAAGAAGTGYAARAISGRMTNRNAELAELLARNGQAVAGRSTEMIKRRIIEAIMGGQVSAQSNGRQ